MSSWPRGKPDVPLSEESETRDSGYAPDRWEFDDEVSRVFDDMLERSIPQYEGMREAVTSVASSFLRPGSHVLDLGCSRGEAIARLAGLKGSENVWFTGLEVSAPMLEAAQARFAGDERITIQRADLRDGLDADVTANVILSVLTLMFVPVNYRQRLLSECYQLLAPKGGLILVEKVLGEGPRLDDVFNANYHAKKVLSGYDPDDIERKRLSLEGVLVPMTASWNVDMIQRAGFREIDVFWRWMNFVGVVAVR